MIPYAPIEDWSVAGRRALASAHGVEIRLLLDEAFSRFADTASLAPFRFLPADDGGDPITAAVEWCVDRFSTGNLDPNLVRPSSRNFRLFTEVKFWLCQKVGRIACDRILRREQKHAERGHDAEPPADLQVDTTGLSTRERMLMEFQQSLSSALRELGHCTCADLVGFWLLGTARLRGEWFGWTDAGAISQEAEALRKKNRSMALHDALFRFLCCYHRLPAEPKPDLSCTVAHATLFRPCQNIFPYRCSDEQVAAEVPAAQPLGKHERRRLFRGGASAWLKTLIEWLMRSASAQDPRQRMEWVLGKHSLSATTLHALDLDADVFLVDSLRKLTTLELKLEDA